MEDEEDPSTDLKDNCESSRQCEKNEVPERKQSNDKNDITNIETSRKKRNTASKQTEGKDASPANEEDGRESCRLSETQKG